jgi:glycosyltransferase involved in cell wall biosynthesis
MRILVTISDQVWGGKQRYMVDLVTELTAAGHLVTPVVESGSAIAEELGRLGVSAALVEPFAAGDEAAIAAIAAQFETGEVDLVCASGRYDCAVVDAALSRVEEGPAVVVYRHSAFPLSEDGGDRLLLDRADLVIATSIEQRQRQFAGEPDSRVVVVPSSVPRAFVDRVAAVDVSKVRNDLAIDEDAFVFAVVARLSWEKGIDRAIRAMRSVGESADEVLLLVVGDGPQRGELEGLAADLELTDRIRFTGHVSDVERMLAVADAVLLTSTVPETGPIALKEAMAAGRPVIASRIGGIAEFVADGVSGSLVSDDAELVDAMNAMWSDLARSTEMGRQGRESIIGAHLIENRTRHLLHCLDRVALARTPLKRFLPELQWDDVRWRDEASGGFVFVPRTSQISEFAAETYSTVRAAISAGSPADLLELPPAAVGEVVETLYEMGAFVRPPVRRAG